MTPEDILETIGLSRSSIRELLQILVQYASNAYLHRFRMYTHDKELKKSIDIILDDAVDRFQRKIAKAFPNRNSSFYSIWRITSGSLPKTNLYNPPRPTKMNKSTYVKAAMEE